MLRIIFDVHVFIPKRGFKNFRFFRDICRYDLVRFFNHPLAKNFSNYKFLPNKKVVVIDLFYIIKPLIEQVESLTVDAINKFLEECVPQMRDLFVNFDGK